jgi:chaperonin GroES
MGTAQRPDPTESVRHQLRPLFDQVVIKELDQDRVRRSGLVVQPGDHVVFPSSAGAWVEVDEERLLVCRVTQLLGVLESASLQV